MTFPDRESRTGAHTFCFQAPDLLRLEFHGTLGLEEATYLVEFTRERSTTGPLHVLADMSHSAPMDPEVQSYLSEHVRPEWFQESICFGARLVHKALIKGLVLAAYLNQLQDQRLARVELALENVHFTSTREEAELLLAELRARAPALKAPRVPPA